MSDVDSADLVLAMCSCQQQGHIGVIYAADATFRSATVRCGDRVFRVQAAVPGTGFAFGCNTCDGSGWISMSRAFAEDLEYPFKEFVR